MINHCERCKKEVFKFDQCNYCLRKVCNDCIKSAMRSPKTRKLVICKDCWSVMPKRSAFKNRRSSVAVEES